MQHTSPEEALEANRDKLLPIFQKYGVTSPRIFGSVARGNAYPKSDIDILISKTAPMDYATIGALRSEVRDALGWPVDLVFESALRPEFLEAMRPDLKPLF